MNFLSSLFTSPTASANIAPNPVEMNNNTSPEKVLGVVETIKYIEDHEDKLRNAKTVADFFEILKPITTFPFSGGISVPKDTVLNRALEHVKNNAIENELPEQTLAKKDTRMSAIISAVKLERAVDGFPKFKNILAETILREMLGQATVQPTPVEIVKPSSEMESSTQTAEEEQGAVQTLSPEGESHHGEMEHLTGPLSAYVSMNTTPSRGGVGGEIAPVGSVAFVAPLTGIVRTPEEPLTPSVPTIEDTTEHTPVSGVETITHEESLPESAPKQEVAPIPEESKENILEEIGAEIQLMTEQEIEELEKDSLETQPKEPHEGVMRPAILSRVKLRGVKPPKSYLQRIEEIVGTFAEREEELLKNYIGRIIGHEESIIRDTLQQKPHLFKGRGRIIGVRLIGARSLAGKEVAVTPANSQLVEAPQKSATVSVLRPKQSPNQDRIPSSTESDSYSSFTAHVENKPTPSTQEQQAPIVESAPDIQTLSPVIEEVVTQSPTEVAQEPTTQETNPLVHLVQENESVRDIVYNHLAHIGAFEGLSEQKQNEILVRAILFVDEKRLVPNVNEVEVGQSIDLSTLTKEILSETDSTTSNTKSVGPFGRFSN